MQGISYIKTPYTEKGPIIAKGIPKRHMIIESSHCNKISESHRKTNPTDAQNTQNPFIIQRQLFSN